MSVNVLNITGASGVTAMLQALSARPDGYTLLMDGNVTSSFMFASRTDLPVKIEDRVYAVMATTDPAYFFANTKTGWKRLEDAIQFLQDEAGAVYLGDVPPTIGQVMSGSVAERAGLLARDRVLTIDGQTIATWDALVAKVRGSPARALLLEVDRGGTRLRLEVTPEPVPAGAETIGRIGAGPYVEPGAMSAYLVEVRYGPGESLVRALAKTWEMSVFSLRMLGKMFVGEVSWRNLSGPVTIADYAGQSAQLGLLPYLAFLALISISLGVLNLLPIPLLDGGHL